ncbi:MAG: NAD(P)/FAD-dependent oxidoreductase [Gammaproteobacteria bacterium]|nr:NAD(P)/FAD-dependent oxidoreductase [Gammaproteobacteria bacterium]
MSNAETARASPIVAETFDAIVIGAGIAGMYQLYRLRELGLSVRVFEAGSGVGGTWYWNRYPGARFDSESYTYGYSFSKTLLEEWNWSEHFSAQPETLRYLEFVADKFDLRRDIHFNSRIASTVYQETENCWEILTEHGERARAKFLITAVGVLSAPYTPDIPGIGDFKGESWHTANWPHRAVDLSNKRVGVIGSGATAVQLITEVAKNVGQLTVFQRTANFCVPLNNRPITTAEQGDLKARYDAMFEQCRHSFGAFIHDFDPRSVFDVSKDAREAIFEKLWHEPGFGFWLGNFHDIMTDEKANATIAEFVRKKIRERVKDPVIAERLTPRDHCFGTKRVPLESGYYEAYNRPNVQLVDLHATPIERLTQKGIKTKDAEYEFDVIIFATGFDAVTGALTRIDIRGEGGQGLKDKWRDGPRTYLGLQVAGFPNLFTVVGAHNAANFCNVPRCIEQNVEWVTACIRYLREHDLNRIRATEKAEEHWRQHCEEVVSHTLFPKTASWFMGANIPGKKRTFLGYGGGLPRYRDKCDEVAAQGYAGFVLE